MIQKAIALIMVVSASAVLIAASVCRYQFTSPPKAATSSVTEAATIPEVMEFAAAPVAAVPDMVIQPPPRTIIGYTARIEERFTVTPRVTCYSKYDGEVEAQGLYASYWNEIHEDLPISEKTIQQYHYTVAMPKELRRYHEELNRLPNGAHYFKWLVHVPEYNSDNKDGPEAWRYYSVPRDTCPQPGRVDVLFTGSKPHVLAKQKIWKQKPTHLPLTFFEVVPVVVYSDGSTEVWKP